MAASGEDDPTDPAAIEEIGYLVAGTVRRTPVDTAHVMVEQGHSRWHVTVDGERHDLEPAERDGVRYLRALPSDSADDPLLGLPSIDAYERDARNEKRFGR